MAITRSTIELPAEVATEILAKTQTSSAIMQLARQIPLPGRGKEIPIITSDPEAAWVSETGAKPVSDPGLSKKIMTAYKLAVLVPFSMEFRRDAAALYDALINRLPAALAEKFDSTVVGAVAAPGDNFDSFSACESVEIGGTDTYANLISADGTISDAGGIMDGIALAPKGKSALLGATDTTGRPLFAMPTEGQVPLVLGARTLIGKGVADATNKVIGVAGDFTQAVWGTVEGVTIGYSEDATLVQGDTTYNLFQQNMFAVRAEIEVGFRADTSAFVLLKQGE